MKRRCFFERSKLRHPVSSSSGDNGSSIDAVIVDVSEVDGKKVSPLGRATQSVDTSLPPTVMNGRTPHPRWKMPISSEDDDEDVDDVDDPSTVEDESTESDRDEVPEVPKVIKVRGRADIQHKAILDGRVLLEDTFATGESHWQGGCTVWNRQKNGICEVDAIYRCVVFVIFVFFFKFIVVLCSNIFRHGHVFMSTIVGVGNASPGHTCVWTVFVCTTHCVCTTSRSGMRRMVCISITYPPAGTVFSWVLGWGVFRPSKPHRGGGRMSTSEGIILYPFFWGEGFFHPIQKGSHGVFLGRILICVPA